MSDEIGIGTVLYVYSYWTRCDGTPDAQERARYRPYTVTSETRGKWGLSAGGVLIEVNKKTLRESGRQNRQAYTASQVEDRLWHYIHRPAILRLVERADTDMLRRVAEVVGYVIE